MARPAQPKDIRLIHKISRLYYEQNLAEGEIAEKFNLSLAKISRLLKYARETGIVQFIVNPQQGLHTHLEEQLESKFHLLEAMVVGVEDEQASDAIARAVGGAAAKYFIDNLHDGSMIGVSWGTTLSAMVASIHPQRSPRSHIIQIIGGLGSPTADAHVTDLCRRLAAALGCEMTLLPAPGIVGSRQAKKVILSDAYVQKAFGLISKIDVAFVGVGAPTPNSVLLRDGLIITRPELDNLLEKGAVGDIALRFFDRNGQPIQSDLDERVIGMSLEQIKAVKRVVGVVGGLEKLAAIRGALLGGFLKVLVVDQPTAERLIIE
jgi:DNA-binding transcriptional regulator LsrR (DeoR family)